MEAWSGAIRSEHLGGEALLLDFGHAVVLSDHPKQQGGSGKGPLPGDLMKGALASSIALAVGEAAERGEFPVTSIAVRCTTPPVVREKLDGPLDTLMYLTDFVVDIVLSGKLAPGQGEHVEAIARNTRVARALTGELELDESNVFLPGEAPGEVALLAEARGQLVRDEESERRSPAQASVEYLGRGRALVNWAQSTYLVQGETSNDPGNGGSPEGLLLASLAACTTVFTARAATRTGGPAGIRVFCKGDFSAIGAGRIEKRMEVVGDLTPVQRESLAYCGDHCALGETLRRRANLQVRIHCIAPDHAAQPTALGTAGEAREALGEIADIVCDDGVCCVPEAAAR
jgi:uncharacterized OsmC-like protein